MTAINTKKWLKELNILKNPDKIIKHCQKINVEDFKKIDMSVYLKIITKLKDARDAKAKQIQDKLAPEDRPFPYNPKISFKQHIKQYFNLEYKDYQNTIKKGCSRCGSHKSLQLHHIKPKSTGGGNELDNLEPLCNDCHHKSHVHYKNIFRNGRPTN